MTSLHDVPQKIKQKKKIKKKFNVLVHKQGFFLKKKQNQKSKTLIPLIYICQMNFNQLGNHKR